MINLILNLTRTLFLFNICTSIYLHKFLPSFSFVLVFCIRFLILSFALQHQLLCPILSQVRQVFVCHFLCGGGWVIQSFLFSFSLENRVFNFLCILLTYMRQDCSMFFESFLTLIIHWQSSSNFCSVRFGSLSNLIKILCQISESSANTNPCTNIRHLKSSALFS